MSKMDGLRAMREARYEQRTAGTAAKPAKPATAAKATARPAAKPPQAMRPPAQPEPDESRLCGHRAISGRTCTREHGHAAKSHRYS